MHRRIESKVQLFWCGQESGIIDRVLVVYRKGKDWRRMRSGSWWTKPLDFFSRHEAVVISLHTLRLHHVGKLSLQNTGVHRLTVGNEKLGLCSQLRSEMRRSFYELVVWKFQGQGIGGSIWLLGTKMQCSGVLRSCLCPTFSEWNQSEPLGFWSESNQKFWNTGPPK